MNHFVISGSQRVALAVCCLLLGVAITQAVPKWGRLEQSFQSSADYANPLQEASLAVEFVSPKGDKSVVPGFWDGGKTWRVRFSPDAEGQWTWTTTCSDPGNTGLHGQKGTFECTKAEGATRFEQHGPVRVSTNGFYLEHADGTPFLWLGDTAWNGALLSTANEWNDYLKERARQQFDAVQWVATQWRAAPRGDREGRLAYTGKEKIIVNPAFFQALDAKADAVTRAGLLNVPVLLWALGGSNPDSSPGVSLPEDQAILLARYMVARWQGQPVAWLLGGDGHYFGQTGQKWKRIGRAVFDGITHAPVGMHPQGRHWTPYELEQEKWVGIIGFQSGHGDSDQSLRWLTEGPMRSDWKRPPHRPFINLEPPYEGHLGYQSKQPFTADLVRRTLYWSLLNTPTAGVTYGGHGVWGWDDGTKPPTDHPDTGTPLPWRQALTMPAAQTMTNVANFFRSIDFWRLRPAPEAIVGNRGAQNPRKYIAAARTDNKDLTVVYVPEGQTQEERTIEVLQEYLPANPDIRWFSPRTGERSSAVAVVTGNSLQFPTPGEGDWLLIMQTQEKAADAGPGKPATTEKK